ncbi:PAS domain-containing sensor histidine kinase [Cyclobacterium sp.]|uniref:PAS domain-containing sensor histidine kinase n=1 Tax=Cyclobacterium sp. TaxID=1966343 RepID=UPI001990CE9D|nr:PAS domain-containing sensor histidine kinase [Cyclobacterium sp.]MBD3627820.1 PAS domain-containing sensor histidine kinase [Cyclobacterium sp.]
MDDSAYDLDLFFKMSPDLLCIAGYDGYYKQVNPSFQKLMGYTEEELLCRPIDTFLYGEDIDITTKIVTNINVGDNSLRNHENRYLTKNGEKIWLSWNFFPLPEKGLIYGIAKNVTYRKEMESHKNDLIRKLTETNDKLRQLTFAASHDLRAPVNNILAIFKLMDPARIEDKETAELIELLDQSTVGLKSMLENLLDNLKQDDVMQVKVEKLRLKEVFNRSITSIRSMVENSGAVILSDFSQLPEIHFNRTYLESIFLNLISNSVKYSRPNTKPLVEIRSYEKEGRGYLEFSDNGLGFNLNMVEKEIFGFDQKFHHHKDSHGIGLYLVHKQVTALGGKIEIKSKPNKGAKFIISLKGKSV